jgi:hypothetical protein
MGIHLQTGYLIPEVDESKISCELSSRPQCAQSHALSWSGSGHEPGHAEYVAHGMLDAAVSGPVLASPHAKHVRAGLQHV